MTTSTRDLSPGAARAVAAIRAAYRTTPDAPVGEILEGVSGAPPAAELALALVRRQTPAELASGTVRRSLRRLRAHVGRARVTVRCRCGQRLGVWAAVDGRRGDELYTVTRGRSRRKGTVTVLRCRPRRVPTSRLAVAVADAARDGRRELVAGVDV